MSPIRLGYAEQVERDDDSHVDLVAAGYDAGIQARLLWVTLRQTAPR